MRKIRIWRFAALSVVLLAGGCSDWPEGLRQPPWSLEKTAQGLRVLGVIPGKTKLREASRAWMRDLEFAVFVDDRGVARLEAFAGKLDFGGVEGRVVLPLSGEDAALKRYIDESPKKRLQQSGALRYAVADAEKPVLMERVVERIVFVPVYEDLDAVILEARFGRPEQRTSLPEGRELWMYPGKGLLLSLDPQGREAFHFTEPERFGEMLELLD